MQNNISATNSPFLGEEWQTHWQHELFRSREVELVGRWTSITLVLKCDERTLTCRFVDGVLTGRTDVEDGGRDAIVLRGSSRAWGMFLLPTPPPLHNDVLALDRRQDDFAVESGRHTLIQNLRFVQLVLALARTAVQKVGNDA
ncbi:hypothetical protein ACJEDT_25550 (plasmid) [Rhodococcoides fascians]|uniref:hypothetical protein n=1 Tax=Rhodococcoides fascians TaxID=1828 RepID=UPI003899E992